MNRNRVLDTASLGLGLPSCTWFALTSFQLHCSLLFPFFLSDSTLKSHKSQFKKIVLIFDIEQKPVASSINHRIESVSVVFDSTLVVVVAFLLVLVRSRSQRVRHESEDLRTLFNKKRINK